MLMNMYKLVGRAAEFVPSRRSGQIVLALDGRRFHRAEDGRGRTRWRCGQRKRGCKAMVFTVRDRIIYTEYEHNHDWSNREITQARKGEEKCTSWKMVKTTVSRMTNVENVKLRKCLSRKIPKSENFHVGNWPIREMTSWEISMTVND